jgi:hypothetical protein
MHYLKSIIALIGLFGQSDTLDDVRLFQTFFEDAAVAETPYVEGFLTFADDDDSDGLALGAQGAGQVNEKIEIGGRLEYRDLDPDRGDSETGLSDLAVYGRFHLDLDIRATVGGVITIPIGDEDVGGDETNVGVFGAVRHPLDNGVVLTGALGLSSIEEEDRFGDDDRELSLLLAGGAIYELDDQFNLVGEVNVRTEEDVGLITGGLDYELSDSGRLRGALGLGFDDGSPDFNLQGGYLYLF